MADENKNNTIFTEIMDLQTSSNDYTKNLYDWSSSKNVLQSLNDNSVHVNSVSERILNYYNVDTYSGLRIAYISDLHLDHHLQYYDNQEQMLEDIVEQLNHSLEKLNYLRMNTICSIFFGGDISETPKLTIAFFSQLRKRISTPIYFVLGNHDYKSFQTVKKCVDFYRKKLQKLQIQLLHNEYVECCHMEDEFIIFGGTGFAKYDQMYNADNLVCCPGFTREDESQEGTLFETAYHSALAMAKSKKRCLLCLTHYPVSACLNNDYQKEVVYFSGHTHLNDYIYKNNILLYADNQIGYEKKTYCFKEASPIPVSNPYFELQDGMYKTSIEDYFAFYRYLGEYFGDGKIKRICKNKSIYVVKRNGIYGFFVVSCEQQSKGISILNGGLTKKLTKSTDMFWICENFDTVVAKYLQMLLPIRTVQEKLSHELKKLGLSGNIHGLIVDIDYYHHIALNPINGTVSFYYSSEFGYKMDLFSFDEVLKSLEIRGHWETRQKIGTIREKYENKEIECSSLSLYTTKLPLTEKDEIKDVLRRREKKVSRKEGFYDMSRKICPLQRLFSNHVLCDFDLRLTDTEQKIKHRKKLYTGNVFKYDGIRYQIIADDGGDIVVAEELEKGSRSKGNCIRLSGKRKNFSIEQLKAKINKKSEKHTYWM